MDEKRRERLMMILILRSITPSHWPICHKFRYSVCSFSV